RKAEVDLLRGNASWTPAVILAVGAGLARDGAIPGSRPTGAGGQIQILDRGVVDHRIYTDYRSAFSAVVDGIDDGGKWPSGCHARIGIEIRRCDVRRARVLRRERRHGVGATDARLDEGSNAAFGSR